ncbi:MAG TPA: glutaminyl-peptide cyclotransferase [Smithellaceae bacterium]|nr:glutaminyl-peptide cyclotransferase [Smithellaceae bacterium]
MQHLKSSKTRLASIRVIHTFPHDQQSFTQGLVYHKGYLYESTGLKGKSALKKIEIKSGRVLQAFNLDHDYFGEGIAVLNGKIFQLTWKNQLGIIYDLSAFKRIGMFNYRGEGWGLTTDGRNLFRSDGSNVIRCIDPVKFKMIREIKVFHENIPVINLNELEFIQGEIWANIFMEDVVVRISPQSGRVLGWIDLHPLQCMISEEKERDVLNGIAYDPEGGRIFVTGKFWGKLFEIEICD